MDNNICFYFFPFDGKNLKVYSKTHKKFFYSDDISNIVWIDENNTIPGQLLTLQEIINNFPKQDGLKKHRSIIAQTKTTHYPIKDIDGYGVWNGVIRLDIDLDAEHSDKIKSLNFTEETYNKIYDGIILCCRNCFPTNFLYIEHSSSGTGVHILFYYDVEATEENFFACAEYTKQHFIDSIDTYIPKMSELLNDKSVFDEIYHKLFQKTYITGKDYIISENCSGYIADYVIEKFKEDAEKRLQQKINIKNSYSANSVDLISSSNNKFSKVIHHTERFKIATALKAATKSKSEWEKEHYNVCLRYLPYKNYTFTDFLTAFDYENLDETAIPATYLEKYGFTVKSKDLYNFTEFTPDETIDLKTGFISDYYDDIIANVNKHNNVYIKGGCGIGKSYFFKNLIKSEDKVIIICHLNSIKNSVYEVEICGEDNPYNVVIPSNSKLKEYIATNSLPSKMILGWDQFAILAEKNINIDDYYKCFDEIHNFVTTVKYRHNTIWKIIKNRDIQKRCILVSATPCGEYDGFCTDCYKMEFLKEVNYTVNYRKVSFDNDEQEKMSVSKAICWFSKKLIERNLFDKVVIFDNRQHDKFAEFWKELACNYNKGNKNSTNIKKLSETNNLEENIFITTVYGTEGIEIKNHIDKLAVLIPLRAETTDVVVEQLINRFRNKCAVNVFFFDSSSKESNLVNTEYDETINKILSEIKNDNPEYLHWVEKENYYLSTWCYWPNTEIKEYIETYPKMVMIYHNYLLSHCINSDNVMTKYNIPKVDYLTYGTEETTDKSDSVSKIIAKYPHIAFERNDDDNCRHILSQFKVNASGASGDNSDLFDLDFNISSDSVKYEEVRALRNTLDKLHSIYDSFGGDRNTNILWNDNTSESICKLANTTEGHFLVKLINAFTSRGLFRISVLTRFINVRKKLNSECITEKQSEDSKKDLAWYEKQVKRLGVTDDLSLDIYNALYHQLKDAEFNDKGERKESGKYKGKAVGKSVGKAVGKAVGKSVGKAVNKKYVSIDNPFISFSSHEDCYEYLKKECKIFCTLGSYIKKSIWKLYFTKE